MKDTRKNIIGVPPLSEIGFKNYLEAYLYFKERFKLNDTIKVDYYYGVTPVYSHCNAYIFFLYELQNLALESINNLLKSYNYAELQKNIFSDSYSNAQYFDSLFKLILLLNNNKSDNFEPQNSKS